MQKITFILGILLLLVFTNAKKYNKAEFEKRLKELQKLSQEKTNGWQLVTNLKTTYFTIATTIKRDKLNQIYQLGIPQHAIEKFKAVVFAKVIVEKTIRVDIFAEKEAKSIQGLGVVELEGDQIKLYYAEATTTGQTIQQKEPVHRKKCKGALFWRKCTHWIDWVPRGFTHKEIDVIKQTLRVRAAQDLNTRIQNLMNLKSIE